MREHFCAIALLTYVCILRHGGNAAQRLLTHASGLSMATLQWRLDHGAAVKIYWASASHRRLVHMPTCAASQDRILVASAPDQGVSGRRQARNHNLTREVEIALGGRLEENMETVTSD